jgi:hypothetical protein
MKNKKTKGSAIIEIFWERLRYHETSQEGRAQGQLFEIRAP